MRFLTFTLLSLIMLLNLPALQAQQSPVKVSSVVVEDKTAKRMITGSLMVKDVVKIASEEAGIIIQADFRQGDIVKKGTVLYKIDDRNLQLELEKAKAELAKSKSLYAQKIIETKYSEKELLRRKKALEKTPGVISENEFSKFQKDFAIAKEVLNMAKIETVLSNIKIKTINKHLKDMVIKAPFDGLLRVKGKEVGEWVSKGEMVAVAIGLNNYEAHFDIPQSVPLQSIIKIKEVEVSIKGVSKTYVANQFKFIAGVNANSRNYTIAGLIKGPSLDLISGRTISTFIPLGIKKPMIKINSNAIIKDPAGYFVYKVTPMGDKKVVAMQTPIKVEFIEGKFHYCTSTMLKTGDKVVTEGNERLRPMAAIMVIGVKE
ncbi:MAG: hypothetical protein COA79_18545 [Planctomycetota bacterium]|nr:MAG: hypothetical protein COA79_18545 [Planctomycetota bacterium]